MSSWFGKVLATNLGISTRTAPAILNPGVWRDSALTRQTSSFIVLTRAAFLLYLFSALLHCHP